MGSGQVLASWDRTISPVNDMSSSAKNGVIGVGPFCNCGLWILDS